MRVEKRQNHEITHSIYECDWCKSEIQFGNHDLADLAYNEWKGDVIVHKIKCPNCQCDGLFFPIRKIKKEDRS